MWKSDDFLLLFYGFKTIFSTIMDTFTENSIIDSDINNFDAEGQVIDNLTNHRRYFDKDNNRRIQCWI